MLLQQALHACCRRTVLDEAIAACITCQTTWAVLKEDKPCGKLMNAVCESCPRMRTVFLPLPAATPNPPRPSPLGYASVDVLQ